MMATQTMRAVAIRPGQPRSAHVVEFRRPRPTPEEYLVRVVEVGIDGTDRELDAGEHGQAPADEELLVLGHEALGRIAEECSGDAYCREGELVVPTVRRPCPERCLNCRNGEPDFCFTGDYLERGIKGLHGYLSEYAAVHADHLVRIPESLRAVGVLVEPMSIVEKAFRAVQAAQQRMQWEPRRVIVTGAGGIGMLAAILARLRGLDVLVYSLGPAAGVRAELLERIGAGYVDAEARSLRDAARDFGLADVVVEATGHSPLAWEAIEALEPNGAACLLSVTGGDRSAEIPSDRLNNRLVLGNRLVFGAVNAHRRDFERGVADLERALARWPGMMERFTTHRLPLERIREALDETGGLKTVIEVGGEAVDG
jgi:threonine dehydrogenase-like Zn-dependent dehydrogenase